MKDTDRILEDAAKLSKEARPQRDLWPGIEAALAEPAPSRMRPWMAQAAAVVLLVGASSGVTWLAMKGESETQIVVQPEYVFDEAAFGSSYNLGPGYTDAHSGLASKLDTQLAKLEPAERARVESNLAIIRDAIDQINAELANDPDNPQLQALLMKTYREELMLMRRVSDLVRTVTSRNDI